MLRHLLPALRRVAPEIRQRLIVSRSNRHLFADPAEALVEVGVGDDQRLRRILADHLAVPRAARGADVLLTPAGVGTLHSPVPHVVIVAAHLALPSCNAAAGPDGLSRWHRVYYGPLLRRSLRRADQVLGISEFLADGLVSELGVPRERVAAMPLGVEGPTTIPPLEGREPVVLFVGTLYGYKDVDVAVRAFARARTAVWPRARLVVAGRDPGSAHTALAAVARAEGCADAVTLAGAVSDAELERLYATASMLVMPSRCEGFGLPVAEAMSRGLPVVVADATSLPEVAGGAGIVVAPGDVDGFARAIVDLLGDEARRMDLARDSVERAGALTWEATAMHLRDAVARARRSSRRDTAGVPGAGG